MSARPPTGSCVSRLRRDPEPEPRVPGPVLVRNRTRSGVLVRGGQEGGEVGGPPSPVYRHLLASQVSCACSITPSWSTLEREGAIFPAGHMHSLALMPPALDIWGRGRGFGANKWGRAGRCSRLGENVCVGGGKRRPSSSVARPAGGLLAIYASVSRRLGHERLGGWSVDQPAR